MQISILSVFIDRRIIVNGRYSEGKKDMSVLFENKKGDTVYTLNSLFEI